MRSNFLTIIFLLNSFLLLGQQRHKDIPFTQDYAIKYEGAVAAKTVDFDRNGHIQVLAESGLKRLTPGQLLVPGKIVDDNLYRFMGDKSIVDLTQVDQQLVYLDEKVIFSNAWAGSLYIEHQVENPIGFLALNKSDFLVYNRSVVNHIRAGKKVKEIKLQDAIKELALGSHGGYYVLTDKAVFEGSLNSASLKSVFAKPGVVSMAVHEGHLVLAHESEGLLFLDKQHKLQKADRRLPSLKLTKVRSIDGQLWIGSDEGAFKLAQNGRYDYYASKRWLNNDRVIDIKKGPQKSVLILNAGGLSKIVFEQMTLAQKAEFYEKQSRIRHIRNGFNSNLFGMKDGDISTGYLVDSDNDGLWTSMYLASQAFRYAVTKSPEALQNTRESLDAMERLYSINPVKGFPARTFERTGHKSKLGDPEHWQKAAEKDWDWKATTSSDEAIGHIFAFGVIAEVVDVLELKQQAVKLIDSMMTHIIENDMYLVDFDGKPTLWGKWNPSYVNGFDKNIGDRKLNSSNIIGMLQTAYHFTKKPKYKEKIQELFDKHGYLENLMRPMEEIGKADKQSDDLSQLLSVYWNHSDDEMYFLGYWGLYRYALNNDLKEKYKASIIDHFEAERPEKDAVWNIMTAMTGVKDFALGDAMWFLQEYPMDLIQWTIKNSQRSDIDLLEKNFRNQYTKEVLPPDELKISRHNANRFILDGGHDGAAENSAGDIWLLPYWMGKYLQVID